MSDDMCDAENRLIYSRNLKNVERVSIYVPASSSMLQNFVEWLTGRRPELIDPTILASGGGRERKEMHRETFLVSVLLALN
ncbi:B9 domain-containing protein 1 [Temnothorax longispinosus]|uniref:B9 domain-containing protein 1 n=1 Tax=Temnothorax longispinosus TaxID=300112 RepID=A0A4S2KKX0_9HYME|nr:B9 domain-containing protein 1 [Temnothorax longispinosus]